MFFAYSRTIHGCISDLRYSGTLEQAFVLPTYIQSLICTISTDVYFLDAKNYERLVNSRRNTARSLDNYIQKLAEVKLATAVARSIDKQASGSSFVNMN
ncbi:unnamed protein product [Protopolystoma xenopodis]|uniref:Cyclic nucleotide-binding domain-containing protein n=1 Tax=Protopolystoma xenopodis TaxID=117903 RepID=A0A3S5FFT5_9PLAT|nr:unnamed protein product [Protopolystoma xenopodis]